MLERGILTPEQLSRRWITNTSYRIQGRPRLLGQTLIDMGLVDRETLDQVITLQIIQLQQALQDANRRLEQRVAGAYAPVVTGSGAADRIKPLEGKFYFHCLSRAAHTPYAFEGLFGASGKWRDWHRLADEQLAAVAVMLRSELRLESLIDDLIQFSLVSRGEMSLNSGQVRLGDLARAAVLQVEPQSTCQEVLISSYKLPRRCRRYGQTRRRSVGCFRSSWIMR